MLTLKEHLDFQIFKKCPICQKEYDEHWKVFTHIKKSKDKDHIVFFEEQEYQCLNIYENSERSKLHHNLSLSNNIFCGMSMNKICNVLRKKYSKEELEEIRKQRISSTMKSTNKTSLHNQNVSMAVKKAWKDGKFDTDEYKTAYQKGISNRPSMKGKDNPMYGKPSPEGSGRGKGGKREDIGHYVRSSWEANICRVSILIKRKYKFEPKSFKIKINNLDYTYTPDFYFYEKDIYYEVKGHAKSRNNWDCKCKNCEKGREAIKQIKEKYGVKIYLIGKHEYGIIKRRFFDRIKNWEDYK